MSTVLIIAGFLIAGLIGGLVKYYKVRKAINSRDKLIQSGHKTHVLFAECEVKSRESNNVKADGGEPRTRVESYDAILANETGTPRPGSVSVIVCKKMSGRGKVVEYRSDLIEMPAETLRFRLEKQVSTYIYVDPENEYNYFFDLRFLYS